MRIPRFPIGAVWRAARRGGAPITVSPDAGGQLPLGLEDAGDPRRAGAPTSPPRTSPPPEPAPAHWDDHPIALTEGEGAQARLRVVSAAAGRAGVRAGMRVSEARALCARLEVLPWDDDVVARAVTEMSALLLEASPQVTPVAGAPGVWWVGAGGFDALGGDRQLAFALLRVARRWHPRPRVAVADSCVAARAATWAGASFERASDDRTLIAVVPAGRDATYLARVPLALVPMDDELRDALRALGLRTAGELASLSAEDVERRWGDLGLAAWRLARGDDPRRPGLLRREPVPAVDVELPAPAATMEPVLFLVRAALDRLVRELASRGRAAASVAITLTLDDARGALPRHAQAAAPAHTVTREVRPARPLARVAPLFERCRALLDGWALTAPVCAVSVAIPATAPLPGDQGDLLDTTWKDAAALEAALARLRAELGPRAVVRPVARDAHRPERAGGWVDAEADGARVSASSQQPTANSQEPSAESREPGAAVSLAFRLLDPPEPAEVEADAEGAPAALTWRERRLVVVTALGPERLSGDWWRDAYSRDYWRCTTADGELLLFRDRAAAAERGEHDAAREWRVQGWYD